MKKSKQGQTMVEYIIIVALIAISLIAAFKFFGQKVGDKVNEAGEAIENIEIKDV